MVTGNTQEKINAARALGFEATLWSAAKLMEAKK